jgi:hypothetical protein
MPRQKLPVTGGREEFKISVPSLCHCEKPTSITAPSGMPGVPFEVNVTLQNPTIEVRVRPLLFMFEAA